MNLLNMVFGSKLERDLKHLLPILHKVNAKEAWAVSLKAEDFPATTAQFRERFKAGETLDDLLPEAYALAREAARRALGERPYDVQLLGGIVLHQGKIMEMKTGEGKTLSSVAAAYLNSIPGLGVHMVTVNDYLAERDAKWMKPVYDYLGVSVGWILSSMDPESRQPHYAADITYATNNELGFDYLRDNMRWEMGRKVQRVPNYAIIDEIDSILIDESRTPLIISGAVEDDTAKNFQAVDPMISFLTECEKDPKTGTYPDPEQGQVLKGDYKLEEKNKRIMFTDEGMNKIEQLLQQRKLITGSLFAAENFEFVHYFTQALRAHKLFHKEVDYVVQEDKVEIVDEFTGRILHGRRYSEGLHQAIEAKERIRVADHNKTVATITFQNYFRLYKKLSGMTGTADTEAKEFSKIYGLDVTVIPTNRPVARLDEDDTIYFNEEFKFGAITEEIVNAQKRGQPVLVGTVSIEKSEKLSNFLTRKGVRHEVLNAKNHAREALIIAEAGAKGSVTIATNMAGRGTDIKLGGNPEFRARKKAGTEAEPEVYQQILAKEMELWRKDYEEVKSLGGLLVIGTERHESRRIDNQLRGRSGRQGDPGRSLFFVSLDDQLMRLFANDNVRAMMGRLGMAGGEPLNHPWLTKSLENAQKKVEDRNFEMRKHLLDYDDVLSAQRAFIYEQRDSILVDDNLKARVLHAGGELLDDLFENWKKADVMAEYLGEALEYLNDAFSFQPAEEDLSELGRLSPMALHDAVYRYLEADLAEKERLAGHDQLNFFIRAEYLRRIDTLWQEHLENMEELRDAVYLRTYAQKNPLQEYKVEGFQKFDGLIAEIKTGIAKKLFKIRIQQAPAPVQTRERIPVQQVRPTHISPPPSYAAAARQGERREAQGNQVTVTRAMPKVGRNDPCPCGSGKKYKLCHGK